VGVDVVAPTPQFEAAIERRGSKVRFVQGACMVRQAANRQLGRERMAQAIRARARRPRLEVRQREHERAKNADYVTLS